MMLYANEMRIEQEAEKLLKQLGLFDTIAPDMITVIIKLKHLKLIKDYKRIPDDELPEDEAAYDSQEKILKLRESVFTAANFPYDYGPKMMRARFTIAHEIGHIQLEHEGIRHRNISDRKIERILTKVRIDEKTANRFASAFLMPRHQIQRLDNLTPKIVSSNHLVSNHAAQIRIGEIERMTRRQTGIRRESPDLVRQFLQEARSKGFKINSLDE